MNQAEFILFVLNVWGIIGGVVAIPFLTFGIDRIDEDARGAFVFRPLLIPGVVMIWPLVLWRWYRLETNKDVPEARHMPGRSTHQFFAVLMPVAMVVIIVTGLPIRTTRPADIAPVQLSSPSEASE